MKDSTKTFDSVKAMRDARNALCRETVGMNFEEQRRYMAERLGRANHKPRNSK